jgi:hypothetical protein
MPKRTFVTSALGRPRGVNKDYARSGLKSWVGTSLAVLAWVKSSAVQAELSVSGLWGWVLRLLMALLASDFCRGY